jgi:hypothetical protein
MAAKRYFQVRVQREHVLISWESSVRTAAVGSSKEVRKSSTVQNDFEARLIVPGHGDPGGWELVENTLKLIERNSK